MKGLIQRFPQALLPLLSIKASETPVSLDESVGGSLEMLPFYLADRLEVVTATQAGLSAVGSIRIPVPANEYWWVWGVNAIATNITVGSNVQLATGIQDPAAVTYYIATQVAPVVSIAGEDIVVPSLLDGFLLRPGCALFAATEVDPGAGTVDLICRGLVARLSSNG